MVVVRHAVWTNAANADDGRWTYAICSDSTATNNNLYQVRPSMHRARLRNLACPKRKRAQRFLAKPLFVLVGRVGIEPMTNGSRGASRDIDGLAVWPPKGAGRIAKPQFYFFFLPVGQGGTAAPRTVCYEGNRPKWISGT